MKDKQLRVDDTHFKQQRYTSPAYRLTPKTKQKQDLCPSVAGLHIRTFQVTFPSHTQTTELVTRTRFDFIPSLPTLLPSGSSHCLPAAKVDMRLVFQGVTRRHVFACGSASPFFFFFFICLGLCVCVHDGAFINTIYRSEPPLRMQECRSMQGCILYESKGASNKFIITSSHTVTHSVRTDTHTHTNESPYSPIIISFCTCQGHRCLLLFSLLAGDP